MAEQTATIEFTEYPGVAFVVRLSPIPLEELLEISALLDQLTTVADMAALVDRWAPLAFVGWEGIDAEPTVENLRRQDFNLLMALVFQWTRAVAKAPLPLPVAPGAGGTSKARRASRSRRS